MKRLLFILFLATVAHAEEAPVIDLGELKVKGDIRRPATAFYQLKSMHEAQLREISDLSFSEFEQKLLQEKTHERE